MTSPQLPPMVPLLWGSLRTLGRAPQGAAPTLGQTAAYSAPMLSADTLQAYHAYFGGFVSQVPLTALYPLAQRAQLALMLQASFPYAVPGMIHVANDLVLHQPLDPTLPLELGVAVTPVPGSDRLRFVVTFTQEGVVRAGCSSLYQPRGARGPRGPRPTPTPFAPAPDAQQEPWTFGADEGIRYARLSGDWNPIHLSPWLSRWFGFPRPILHGMNAVGRGLAVIERTSGQPVTSVSVNFKKPIPLPSTPVFLWQPTSGTFDVATADLSVRHLEGQFTQ